MHKSDCYEDLPIGSVANNIRIVDENLNCNLSDMVTNINIETEFTEVVYRNNRAYIICWLPIVCSDAICIMSVNQMSFTPDERTEVSRAKCSVDDLLLHFHE